MTADPIDLSATELASAIRARTLSSVEVVTAHLRQIERVNPHIHAVVALSETALDDAQRADAALAGSDVVGPLHGVPFTVKDWIETKGLVCAAGYQERASYVPAADATVVARMRAAGAILLGKTKPGSGADLHPAPKNPFDADHTPGASSSGEAAIIAARGSPLGIGSDSGGSLRWPAHCCGVATLKPTSGVVPLTGHFPPIIALTDPRTVIGPLARTVADLAVTLPIIAGEDGNDPSVVPVALGDVSGVEPRAFRVAWFTAFDGARPDAPTVAAVEDAVGALRERGATLTAATPPRIDESLAITKAYWARPESMSERSWKPWGQSTLSADEIERSLFEWHRLRQALARFMRSYDVIVCPVAPTAAPRRNKAEAEDYVYTLPFSLTGYPVVVVRMGTSEDGLPIGVQVVAKPFREHVALAAAAVLEAFSGRWPAPD
jgi:amidase